MRLFSVLLVDRGNVRLNLELSKGGVWDSPAALAPLWGCTSQEIFETLGWLNGISNYYAHHTSYLNNVRMADNSFFDPHAKSHEFCSVMFACHAFLSHFDWEEKDTLIKEKIKRLYQDIQFDGHTTRYMFFQQGDTFYYSLGKTSET